MPGWYKQQRDASNIPWHTLAHSFNVLRILQPCDNESRGREETLGHGPSVGIESKVKILLSRCGTRSGVLIAVSPLRLFSEQGPLYASQGRVWTARPQHADSTYQIIHISVCYSICIYIYWILLQWFPCQKRFGIIESHTALVESSMDECKQPLRRGLGCCSA